MTPGAGDEADVDGDLDSEALHEDDVEEPWAYGEADEDSGDVGGGEGGDDDELVLTAEDAEADASTEDAELEDASDGEGDAEGESDEPARREVLSNWLAHGDPDPSTADADKRMAALFRAARDEGPKTVTGPAVPAALAAGAAATAGAAAGAEVRPSRRRRTGLLIGALVLVLVLVVGGVAIVANTRTSAPPPANAVEQAVTTTVHGRTADVSLSVTVGVEGSHLRIAGNGDMNLQSNKSNLTLTYELGGQSVAERAVVDGSVGYYNVGTIVPYVAPGKSWISIDLGSNGSSSGVGAGGIFTDPGALVSLLGTGEATVRDLGPTNVDGTRVQAYAVDLNGAGMNKVVHSERLPAYLRRELTLVHYSHIDYDLLVDGAHHVRQVRVTGAYSYMGVQATIASAMGFSDFGRPVTIVDPPAGQVITVQQFDKIVAQDQGNTST